MPIHFYRPQTKFGARSYFYTCLSLCSQRGRAWGVCVAEGVGMHGRGACMVGGVHGRGVCMQGGHVWWEACMVGGHAWQGACMAGVGVHGISLGLVSVSASVNTPITRMHSSRMRTVCCSGRLGVCVCVQGVSVYTPLWTEFLKHACENITFLQLLLRTVTTSCVSTYFYVRWRCTYHSVDTDVVQPRPLLLTVVYRHEDDVLVFPLRVQVDLHLFSLRVQPDRRE